MTTTETRADYSRRWRARRGAAWREKHRDYCRTYRRANTTDETRAADAARKREARKRLNLDRGNMKIIPSFSVVTNDEGVTLQTFPSEDAAKTWLRSRATYRHDGVVHYGKGYRGEPEPVDEEEPKRGGPAKGYRFGPRPRGY